MSLKLHSPIPATLRIHRSAFDRVAQNLEPVWLVEDDCVAAKHQSYFRKLQKLELALNEVAAELRDLLPGTPRCSDCADTADEWDRFEADRPAGTISPEARVETAELEARASGEYRYTPHPEAVGGCDLAIHAGNWGFGDERRGA